MTVIIEVTDLKKIFPNGAGKSTIIAILTALSVTVAITQFNRAIG